MAGRRPRPWALAALAVGLWPAPPQEPQADAERPAPGGVTWVRVDGALDTGTLSLLNRAIDEARDGSGNLVIELDSPGGEVTLMWRIARAVDAAGSDGVATTAWVNDHAVSAGALLALACDQIYMRSQASIGSATAIQMGPTGLVEMGEHERAKMNSALRSDFRGMAQAHGRPGVLADAMVDKDIEAKWVRLDGELVVVTDVEYDDAQERGARVELLRTVSPRGELLNLTGREAVELGMADGLAEDAEELLDKIGLAAERVDHVARTRSEDLASFLQSISGLLLTAALILGFMELKAPGFGVPGILAITCFAVFLFGRYLVGLADVPHVVLMVAGLVLVAVEILLLPGFLWTGILGGVLLLAGLVLTWLGDSLDLEYAMDRQLLLDGTYRLMWLAVVAAFAAWGVSRFLPHAPIFGRLVLRPAPERAFAGAMQEAHDEHDAAAAPGAVGRALTALRPVGKVALDGHPGLEFEARAEGTTIDAQHAVRVVEVHAGRLVVAQIEGDEEA